MISFKILKKSRKSLARIGILKTPHGKVITPALVPVATQATIKALNSQEVEKTKTQILIVNTFHLHLNPGEKVIQKAGGIHHFMGWKKPIMSDSGGFQVFSFGFGKALGVGKILKYFPEKKEEVEKGVKIDIKILNEGVVFKSPKDGKEIFLGPRESIKIQEAIGSDIIFTFDECTHPLVDLQYAKIALKRTHYWAKICLKTKKSDQALFGIIQGSRFKRLREESAKFINSLEFDGFGIGGDLGYSKKMMHKIIEWCIPHLDPKKPRHLLGIGALEDIREIVKRGIDLFDSTIPTHYARRGIAFGSFGKIDLTKRKFLGDHKKLDPKCFCFVCQNFSRSYLCHLFRAKEISAFSLLTFHNLYFFNTFLENIRREIQKNQI